jgi:hypothetical protein
MRYITIVVSLCSISLLFHNINAYSSEDNIPVNVSVDVSSVFGLEINPQFINFGTIKPGQNSGSEQVILSCSTNNNKPWEVNIYSSSPLSSGEFTIPNDNFNIDVSSSGSGDIDEGSGHMEENEFTIYTCALDEYITAVPVDINLNLSVDVPANQAAGTYVTGVIVTMTEQ